MEGDMKSPHEGEGPGRPKKNPQDIAKHSHKTVYFPSTTEYDIAWNEFERLCIKSSKPFLYNRNKYHKRGTMIRRLILNHVLTNTTSDRIKEVVKTLIQIENQERISKWEKDNGKTYKPKI